MRLNSCGRALNADDVFALWQRLSGDPGDRPWGADHARSFFQGFRPDGEGLDAALRPLPEGDAVLERLRLVFAATAGGYPGAADTYDCYFIVRRPALVQPAEALGHAREFLANVAAIADLSGDGELGSLIRNASMSCVVGAAPRGPERHDVDLAMYDVLCDWELSLLRNPPWVNELEEAFYSIACDYYLAWHLMWPWLRGASPVEEPFWPYFELWRRGVALRFESESSVFLYLPAGA